MDPRDERSRSPHPGDDAGSGDHEPTEAVGGGHDGTAIEADLLRAELQRLSEELAKATEAAAEAQDRYLRGRADLDNLRRRQQAELERAREQGFDAALHTVLRVHDDLNRALDAAKLSSDASTILPGVEGVLTGLLRDLGTMDVHRFGEVGEVFDPSRYEALAVVPANGPGQGGAVQSVFETGFVQGERLVRPARVVVFEEG